MTYIWCFSAPIIIHCLYWGFGLHSFLTQSFWTACLKQLFTGSCSVKTLQNNYWHLYNMSRDVRMCSYLLLEPVPVPCICSEWLIILDVLISALLQTFAPTVMKEEIFYLYKKSLTVQYQWVTNKISCNRIQKEQERCEKAEALKREREQRNQQLLEVGSYATTCMVYSGHSFPPVYNIIFFAFIVVFHTLVINNKPAKNSHEVSWFSYSLFHYLNISFNFLNCY